MTTILSAPKQPAPTQPGSISGTRSGPSGRRRTSLSRRRRRNQIAFWLLAGPNLLLLLLFTYRPLALSLYYSTLQWNVGSPVARPVGLGNYLEWFADPDTLTVLGTTAFFTLATVGGAIVLGLGLALLLNRKLAGRGFARSVAFAPYVLSGVAVGMLWLFIFDPRYGLLSVILGWLGIGSPDWYNSSPWALIMLIVVYLWKNVGYVALIYLAGLQSIPKDVLDAAALDGAGRARTVRSIVLPLLGPSTFFLLVTTTLSSLQSFDIIQAMTQGGPLGTTTTLMYQIYEEGFVVGRAGYASAVATVLFLILLVVTAVQMRFTERKVHYA